MAKDDSELVFLPLGGLGEIGMNAALYGYGPKKNREWILVDCGVAFAGPEAPGVDLYLPDLRFIETQKERLKGIIITHAHEDHIGAVMDLWPRLKAPLYATQFAADLLEVRRFQEPGAKPIPITVVEPGKAFDCGSFNIEMVRVAHSIPESTALAIKTPAGVIVHSGDWKIDKTPVVGWTTDEERFRALGDQGVLALVCDSTNVNREGISPSEADVSKSLAEIIGQAKARVAVTTFASNVARLKTLAEAGRAAGRTICLLGRAMKKMVLAGEESGVLQGFPRHIGPEDAQEVPRKNLMLIVTGSQGERRAASAQLARGKYLGLELREGDTFLFSSKTIPGNEREVLKVVNALSEKGVTIVDDSNGKYHVSGHANRPDLEHVHRLLLPDMVLPMHGEHRHLREHVRLAKDAGIAALVATNGMMIDLTGDTPKVVDRIEAGRIYLDGSVLIGAMDGVVRDRIRMALNGHVTVTLIVDEDGEALGEPWVDTMGLPTKGRGGRDLSEVLEADLGAFVSSAGRKLMADDDQLEEALKRAVRQVAMEVIGKKPEVIVVISRLSAE